MTREKSAAELAYEAILGAILDGVHEPGTMLGEASLAAEIGVSRTPVRAALARLQDEGWITVYPKRGALVRGLGERDVADLASARLVLESAGVQGADAEARRGLATRLGEEIAIQRAAFETADLRAFVESSIAFHRSFVEVGGNRVMLELYDRLADRQRFLLFSFGDQLIGRCSDIIAEHEALVESLGRDRPAEFAAALRGHLVDTYETPLDPLCPDPVPAGT